MDDFRRIVFTMRSNSSGIGKLSICSTPYSLAMSSSKSSHDMLDLSVRFNPFPISNVLSISLSSQFANIVSYSCKANFAKPIAHTNSSFVLFCCPQCQIHHITTCQAISNAIAALRYRYPTTTLYYTFCDEPSIIVKTFHLVYGYNKALHLLTIIISHSNKRKCFL